MECCCLNARNTQSDVRSHKNHMMKSLALSAILFFISLGSVRADCGALQQQVAAISTEIAALAEGGHELIELNLRRNTNEANEEGLIYAQNTLEAYNRYISVLEQGVDEGCFGDWLDGFSAHLNDMQQGRQSLLNMIALAEQEIASSQSDTDEENDKEEGTYREQLNEMFDEEISSINRIAPIEVDSSTDLVRAIRHENVLSYIYQIKEDIDSVMFSENIPSVLLSRNCSGEMRSLIVLGFEIRFDYMDPRGLLLASVLVTRDKCLEWERRQLISEGAEN